MAALEQKIINETTKILCQGSVRIGLHEFHCLHHHGWMDIKNAIEKSCNCFFYTIATKLNIDLVYRISKSLGLGSKSNLDLIGESSGLLPNQEWKQKRFHDQWRAGDSANLAIGQGYLNCTPLQLNRVVASIASGKIINYSLLKDEHIECPDNDLISQANLGIVRRTMFGVVNSPGGTCYRTIGSKYAHLNICGKTGTAQVFSEREKAHHSLFIGFMPFDKPRYALSIVGEFAGYGAQFAAPKAGEIFNFIDLWYNKNTILGS